MCSHTPILSDAHLDVVLPIKLQRLLLRQAAAAILQGGEHSRGDVHIVTL